MFRLETPRLLLLQTPLEVIQKRLETDNFNATIQNLSIHFPPEWPGLALDMFPMWAEHLSKHPESEEWGGILVEKSSLTAVGQMGCKGKPTPEGMVEIGYGINLSFWGRGYATEAVQALVAWLWQQPNVEIIRAETLPENLASRRVLEKTGFSLVGTRHDPDDGEVIVWEQHK